MASNFASILDKPVNEIERPRPLPIGTYHCVVRGQPRFDKSAKKQTPFVEFTLVPQQALDDVDQDFLREALTDAGTGTVKALNEVSFAATYYYESQGWRLKQFLEHCGLDVDGGHTIRALIDETVNASVLATIRHETGQDGESVYARIASTARAE